MQNIGLTLALGLVLIAIVCIVVFVFLGFINSVKAEHRELEEFISEIAGESFAITGFFDRDGQKLYEVFADPEGDPNVCVLDQQQLDALSDRLSFMVFNHIQGGTFTEDEVQFFAGINIHQAVIVSTSEKKLYSLEPISGEWGMVGDISEAFAVAEEEVIAQGEQLTDAEHAKKVLELVAQDLHYKYVVRSLTDII